jgi:hypothetical protein
MTDLKLLKNRPLELELSYTSTGVDVMISEMFSSKKLAIWTQITAICAKK